MFSKMPKIPIGDFVESLVDWILLHFGSTLLDFGEILDDSVDYFNEEILLAIPPEWFILIISFLAYFVGRKNIKMAFWTAAGFLLILNQELWEMAMETLALVISSAILALFIGIPTGILSAKSEFLERLLRPLLDFMQTMPSMVYLVPAIFFFSIGNAPGIFATIIFAMPPAIRLTSLGIRQVPKELDEVADAFGSNGLQKLLKVELPVALPTILAGVNQCIMLSLSMVVISSMIGVRGLGSQVLYALQRTDIGLSFEAGLGVVIIAMFLDRISQSLSLKKKG